MTYHIDTVHSYYNKKIVMIHRDSIQPFALWSPFFFKEANLIEVTNELLFPFEYSLSVINVIFVL